MITRLQVSVTLTNHQQSNHSSIIPQYNGCACVWWAQVLSVSGHNIYNITRKDATSARGAQRRSLSALSPYAHRPLQPVAGCELTNEHINKHINERTNQPTNKHDRSQYLLADVIIFLCWLGVISSKSTILRSNYKQLPTGDSMRHNFIMRIIMTISRS